MGGGANKPFRLAHTRGHVVGTRSGNKSLYVYCIGSVHVAGTVCKLVHMKWNMRHENHQGCLGTSFSGMLLLFLVYFVAGTVCKSSAHDATVKTAPAS